MTNRFLNSVSWLVISTFSIHLTASVIPERMQPAAAEPWAGELVRNPERMRIFTENLIEERRRDGWRIESRPGHAFSLADFRNSPEAIYMTPPASQGIDVAFRIRTSFSGNSTLRTNLTAYNRSFSRVMSRRSIALQANQRHPEHARLMYEQAIQSMTREIEAETQASRTGAPESLWSKLVAWMIPSAHASPPSYTDTTVGSVMFVGAFISLCAFVVALGATTSSVGTPAAFAGLVGLAIVIFAANMDSPRNRELRGRSN